MMMLLLVNDKTSVWIYRHVPYGHDMPATNIFTGNYTVKLNKGKLGWVV